MSLTVAERLYHGKLRKLAETLRDRMMAGAPTPMVAAQLAYHAASTVFAISGPSLDVGDTRSQRVDSREIAEVILIFTVELIESMPPATQMKIIQTLNRGLLIALASDPGHPLHPAYLRHIAAVEEEKPDGQPK